MTLPERKPLCLFWGDAIMGTVFLTVAYGKEGSAIIEALDLLMPHDPEATAERPEFGGLAILNTSLDSDMAARLLSDGPASLLRSASPVDAMVRSDLQAISGEVERLLRGIEPSAAAVRCARRGRSLSSSQEVECEVGRLLEQLGFSIDLRKPSLVVRIDVIGERTAISIRPPELLFKNRCPR